jgi:hypothetical protein
MPLAMIKDAERLDEDLFWVEQTIMDAKTNPLTPSAFEAETKRLTAYGAKQAKKLRVKERDVVRRIHESRAARKT